MSDPSSFDPDAYLAQKSSGTPSFDPDAYLQTKGVNQSGDGQPSAVNPPPSAPTESIGQATLNSLKSLSPVSVAKSLTPENLSQQLPVMGTVAGSMLAGPAGAAIGAGLGQIGKRMAGMAYGTEPLSTSQPPSISDPSTYLNKESVAPMVQSFAAGIPGVSGVFTPGENTVSQAITKGYASAGQTISGAKKDVLQQATKQGLSTYMAPSLPKAQQIFADALGPEGQAAFKTTAAEAFDPELGQARSFAREIGTKIESGQPVSAVEALQARQATDRIISATSWKDKMARAGLYDWRNQFDNVMTSQSGELKNASTVYRQALVKDQLMNPTRLNKSGEPSALLPMLAGIAGPLTGYERGATGKGVIGSAALLAGTSPMTWGAGAVAMGALNPTVRAALISKFIDLVTNQSQGASTKP